MSGKIRIVKNKKWKTAGHPKDYKHGDVTFYDSRNITSDKAFKTILESLMKQRFDPKIEEDENEIIISW